MREQNEVRTLAQLNEGENVHMTGNGLNETGVVDDVSVSSWSGSESAYIKTDTHTWKVTEHPEGGLTAQVGAVTITKE